MGDNSDSEQIGSRADLIERIRAWVDAAGQLLEESADRLGAAGERIRQAHLQAEQARRTARLAQEHIASTRERAARAKDPELAAHLQEERLHTDAAGLPEQSGHPHRAARARGQGVRARELYELALFVERTGGTAAIGALGDARAILGEAGTVVTPPAPSPDR